MELTTTAAASSFIEHLWYTRHDGSRIMITPNKWREANSYWAPLQWWAVQQPPLIHYSPVRPQLPKISVITLVPTQQGRAWDSEGAGRAPRVTRIKVREDGLSPSRPLFFDCSLRSQRKRAILKRHVVSVAGCAWVGRDVKSTSLLWATRTFCSHILHVKFENENIVQSLDSPTYQFRGLMFPEGSESEPLGHRRNETLVAASHLQHSRHTFMSSELLSFSSFWSSPLQDAPLLVSVPRVRDKACSSTPGAECVAQA